MKGAYQLFSRLGLIAMRIYIAARRSFPILRLVVPVLCASGMMFAQAPPEASPLSLQQAASMVAGKEPAAQSGTGGYESCIGRRSGSAFVSDAPSQLLRNGEHGVTIPYTCSVASFGSSVSQ